MARESEKDVDVAEKSDVPAAADSKSKEVSKKKKRKQGLISRIWHGVVGSGKDDFQSRLEKISKEEAVTLARVRKRAQSSRRTKMQLITLTLALEVFAVGYAIITTRSVEDWKERAVHVLPIFALPAFMAAFYCGYFWCINICERKDQTTLERLREERQSKIDELKEKTNFYITQQLIQKYDTDPAAKAAAAAVLASKLGAESGLKLLMEGDNSLHAAAGRSNDVELVQSRGLRNRRQPNSQSALEHPEALALQQMEAEIAELSQPTYVDHYEPGQGGSNASSSGGGWLARLAAMLVGEDPTQCYALICGNCHMHNGLASKEDFPYVTYICPHCRAVNGPRMQDVALGAGSSTQSTLTDNDGKALTSTDQSSREGTPDIHEVPTPLTTEESNKAVVAPED